MSLFVFWEKFSAFVETTIKMFGINGLKGDNFQFNFRNIRAPTKRLNMQKYHVFLPCLQISSTMMHNVHLVEICCSICKKSSIQAFHFHLEHVKGAASWLLLLNFFLTHWCIYLPLAKSNMIYRPTNWFAKCNSKRNKTISSLHFLIISKCSTI